MCFHEISVSFQRASAGQWLSVVMTHQLTKAYSRLATVHEKSYASGPNSRLSLVGGTPSKCGSERNSRFCDLHARSLENPEPKTQSRVGKVKFAPWQIHRQRAANANCRGSSRVEAAFRELVCRKRLRGFALTTRRDWNRNPVPHAELGFEAWLTQTHVPEPQKGTVSWWRIVREPRTLNGASRGLGLASLKGLLLQHLEFRLATPGVGRNYGCGLAGSGSFFARRFVYGCECRLRNGRGDQAAIVSESHGADFSRSVSTFTVPPRLPGI